MTADHPPEDLVIRPALAADLAGHRRPAGQRSAGQIRERDETPLPDAYAGAFAAIDADPNNEVVVAEHDGAVIGTLQITVIVNLTYQGGRRAQIEGVRVAESYRSRGIGQALFHWAIDRARARDCHMVQLTADKTRPDAHRFYESFGFTASHVGMKLHLD